MDEKTLTALQGSIAKWEAIISGTGIDEGTDNCPLCREFYLENEDDGEDGCAGCPVAEATGLDCCIGTPYEKWGEYMYGKDLLIGNPARKAFDEESTKLAQAELDFLRSLVPQPTGDSSAAKE